MKKIKQSHFEMKWPTGVTTRLALNGRPAWCLGCLISAGRHGITAADFPAGLRLSGFIHKLRQSGVEIQTSYEPNSGEFGGSHARYRLVSSVVKVSVLEAT